MKLLLASASLFIALGAHAVGPTFPASVTELIVRDSKVGGGATAVVGQATTVHYSGWLYAPGAADGKGKPFDSSLDRKQPFVFTPGAGRVIKGWEQGVIGMQVGGKRTLIIPASLAYGERTMGNGLIPPNSTLLFEIELLGVEAGAKSKAEKLPEKDG